MGGKDKADYDVGGSNVAARSANLVLVLDTSGSMSGARLDAQEAAVNKLLTDLSNSGAKIFVGSTLANITGNRDGLSLSANQRGTHDLTANGTRHVIVLNTATSY